LKNATEILNNLKIILNFKTDTDLAGYFGVDRSTLAGWKSRNSLDFNLMFEKLNNENINLHYILTGEGSPKKEEIRNDIVMNDVSSKYRAEIKELKADLKKTDAECEKDIKDTARLELEINQLRAKLEYADTLIDKLLQKQN
jgi:hypothetical protein